MAAMQLEARDFAARFREMHSLRLRPNLPPLELEQAPATLDDGAADPLGTGSTVWRGGDALARALAADDALRGAIEGKRVVELGSGTGVAGLACEMQFDGVWHGGAIKSARDVEGGRRQVSFAYRRHKGVQQDLVLPDDLDVLRVPTAAAAKRPRGAAAPAPRKKPRVAVGTVVEKSFKAVSATRKFRGAVVGPAATVTGVRSSAPPTVSGTRLGSGSGLGVG